MRRAAAFGLLALLACKGSEPPVSDRPQSHVELVTGGAAAEAALPLIIAIHGLGDTPENFQVLLQGASFQARVILPQGLDPVFGGGWSWFPIRAGDIEDGSDALATGIERAANGLLPWLDEQAAKRPTVGKVILTGFSQGGMLTYALSVKSPDHYTAAVPISGMLPARLLPSAPFSGPALVALHGDADRVVPIAADEATVAAIVGAGGKAELRRFAGVGHEVSQDMRAGVLQLLASATASAAANR